MSQNLAIYFILLAGIKTAIGSHMVNHWMHSIDTKPVPTSHCKFPFQFNNKVYFACTMDGDKGKPWCVIQENLQQNGQDWRYCDMASLGNDNAMLHELGVFA